MNELKKQPNKYLNFHIQSKVCFNFYFWLCGLLELSWLKDSGGQYGHCFHQQDSTLELKLS